MLVAAVNAAGLTDALSQPGNRTVFAPVNSAFAAVPAAQLQFLLDPAHKAELTKVLLYHAVPVDLMASDLKDGEMLRTLNVGQNLTVHIVPGAPPKIMVNQANIIKADIIASNGIIHLIDSVLVPGNLM